MQSASEVNDPRPKETPQAAIPDLPIASSLSVIAGPPTRLLSLDILRAMAVILVIVRHLPGLRTPTPTGSWILDRLIRGGWIGVDLFFVLSGFLVSGLLFREFRKTGSIHFRRFLIRRGLKIYPAFYVFLAITVTICRQLGDGPPLAAIVGEALFLQNYWCGFWNHTWSLAVEEHFYLLLAFVLHRSIRQEGTDQPFKHLPAGCLFIAFACLGLRSVVPGLYMLFLTHFRLDSLSFGVLLSYYWQFHQKEFVIWLRPVRGGLIPIGILLLSPAFIWPIETTRGLWIFGLTSFYLGGGIILAGILLCSVPTNVFTRGLGMIGAHSYSIYLWHMPVIIWLIPSTEEALKTNVSPGVELLMALGLSIVIGILMAKLIEFPILRLRDRWIPSP